MPSAFDTEVYTERNRLPGVSISLVSLMKHLLWSREGQPTITLSLEYRKDVETSQWWELKSGDELIAGATTLDLCLFRAAVVARRDDERAKK